MSVLDRPLTYDDLLQMPADGNRYEIAGGELHVAPPPSKKHQQLARRLTRVFDDAVSVDGWGEMFFAPVDVHLSPHDTVQPDLLVLRRDRLHLFGPRGVEGPPDVGVEILSPPNRAYDQVRKAALYARAGVPEYWQADTEIDDLLLIALGPNQIYVRVPADGGVVRSTVLPGLAVDIAQLYAGLD